jgi:hypothetical protein
MLCSPLQAFLKRERGRLQLLKARSDRQLAAARRRAAEAASLPQVLQQSQAQHLKGQLQAARQALAARDKGQHAAVLKVRLVGGCSSILGPDVGCGEYPRQIAVAAVTVCAFIACW